jgi:DNA-binding response OmpR family regulator
VNGVIVVTDNFFLSTYHFTMSRILVVDDDPDILTIVQILLRMNNFTVMAISKWQDITKTIKSFTPDLILLDVALSGADGREICRQLKESYETQHIPVILFSAHYSLADNIQEFMANGLITKPFETSYLLETIRKNMA